MLDTVFRTLGAFFTSCVLVGCAPGDALLDDESAWRDGDALEGCPTTLQTPNGDAFTLLSEGSRRGQEERVLEAMRALEESGVPECFRDWAEQLWPAAMNGVGARVLGPMIDAGLDPELTDMDIRPLCSGCTGSRRGMTTLHFATRETKDHPHPATRSATAEERVEMVEVLLERGVSPGPVCAGGLYRGGNQVGAAPIGGATPLMFTAAWDDQDAAFRATELLLGAGADVNVRVLSGVGGDLRSVTIGHGETALTIARRHENAALVDLLLSAGAVDWDLEAEQRAAMSTSVDEVREILTTKTVDHGRIWSLWFDEWPRARSPIATLLDAGLDPSATTWGAKYTPLGATVLQAGIYDRLLPDDLRAIVDAGASADDPGSIGVPPLVAVIDAYNNNRYWHVLTMLLDAGANVDGRAHDGDTPLLRTMYVGSHPAVQTLFLAAGADPNVANHVGQRPLTVAIRAPKTLAMIDELLAHGADLNADVAGAPVWASALGRNPLYEGKEIERVSAILDRVVHHPSLVIDLSSPPVQQALERADSNPLVKPFADVIRSRG
jgi:ankyrin repeat protein